MTKIMLCDDEDDIRGLFKSVLEEAGFETESASSGKECLQKLRREKIDLVLMDMFMPGLSGREVFERMIQDEKLKNIKVAFLTVADLGEQGRAELSYMGAVDYIKKPIANEELVARVKKMVK